MYYILNETHQVIAADDNFLTYCDAAHINELFTKIAKGVIEFDLRSDGTVTLTRNSKEEVFSIEEIVLSSLLGKLTLISIPSEIAEEDPITSSILEDEPSGLIDSIVDDAKSADKEKEENLTSDDIASDNLPLDDIQNDNSYKISEDEQITFGDHLTLDDALDDEIMSQNEILNKEDAEKITEVDTKKSIPPIDLADDDELFNLVLEDETPKSNEEENETTDFLDLDDLAINFDLPTESHTSINLDDSQEEVSEIFIDSESISQKIGISNDDYKNFLNDFIDTALKLEKDLQSSDTNTRDDAISTLSHLSDVLHLPVVSDIISNIKNNDTQKEDIESLYSTLSRITTQKSAPQETEETSSELESEKVEDEKLELFEEATPIVTIQESVATRNAPKGETFGTISLEGIKPKHFDFQLEEAANDLSLPVELIEEFVNDFIDQARIETKKMLQAYEDGDLDAIQKIGHLLKGASSNLRINALSDTLYKIQFCEKSAHLESLIKDYWAHFLSFETQINAISH